MQKGLLLMSAGALLVWAAVSSAAEFGFNTNRGDGGKASVGEAAVKVTSLDANDIVVPTPLSVGIDDLGWKRGWSGTGLKITACKSPGEGDKVTVRITRNRL